MAGIIIGNSASDEGILGIAHECQLISIDFSNKDSDEVKNLLQL